MDDLEEKAESVEEQAEEVSEQVEELGEKETGSEAWRNHYDLLTENLNRLNREVADLREKFIAVPSEETEEVAEEVTEEVPTELTIEEPKPTRKKRAKRFSLHRKK